MADRYAEAQAFARAWDEWAKGDGSVRQFAKKLGIDVSGVFKRRRSAEKLLGRPLEAFTGSEIAAAKVAAKAKIMRADPAFTAEAPPNDDIPIEELVRRRLEDTERTLKVKDAAELVNVRLNIAGPYAVALIGDPHIDNPGANLKLLLDHTRLIRETEGLYAVCVGDLQDGWIGRLARLWAGQGIKARDSQRLVDYWLQQFGGRLVAVCQGNHDLWVHGLGGADPIAWIAGQLGAINGRNGVRLAITQQDGHRVTINMRHDYPGRSQFNHAHGPLKSLLWGNRDDVAVAGHTHVYGYSCILDPDTRRPMHAVRLGSYKWADDYAAELGLKDNNVTECAVLVVRPDEPDPRHRTIVVQDPYLAARMLTTLREDWRRGKGAESGQAPVRADSGRSGKPRKAGARRQGGNLARVRVGV